MASVVINKGYFSTMRVTKKELDAVKAALEAGADRSNTLEMFGRRVYETYERWLADQRLESS